MIINTESGNTTFMQFHEGIEIYGCLAFLASIQIEIPVKI